MTMPHGSKLILGATLFSTPELKSGPRFPGIVGLLIVLLMVLLPVALYLRGGSRPSPPNSDGSDGGGGGPDPPPTPRDKPRGGIPLDDGLPARVRLRGKARLADHLPARVRRPAREPERRPAREPDRGAALTDTPG